MVTKKLLLVEKHGEFQMYYYAHHLNGNRNQRDKYKGHKYYQDTVNFCENWDQKSFDPNFKSLSSHIRDWVERFLEELLAYCTTWGNTNRYTPYVIYYGKQFLLPIEF